MKRFFLTLGAVCALAALGACAADPPPAQGGDDAGATGPDAGPAGDDWDQRLADREYDYNAALRIAALRLTGELPTLAQIKFVADASDQRAAYEALIADYLEDPRFARQMVAFWRDAFKMGGSPMLDTAPVFAAQVTVEGRSYAELFTATAGTCPGFDASTGTFTAADCNNGVPTHAGILSNPGVQAHFASNMAFRRVRWIQETFVCTAYPAEIGEPKDVGGNALYTAPWPLESIAGSLNGGSVDFHDTEAVACANCHATMNHVAPLVGNFDDAGNWSQTIQVRNPTQGLPITQRTDWLPDGEPTAWRFGEPVADLPALGAVMATDPDVARCAVARTWNWAFGKGDIVDTLSLVPDEVIGAQTTDFIADGMRLEPLIYAVFTSEDFVKF